MITHVIDHGGEQLPYFAYHFVSIWKFGYGTYKLIPPDWMKNKVEILTATNTLSCLGGTAFELAVHSNTIDEYIETVKEYGLTAVEISSGTIDLDLPKYIKLVQRWCPDVKVLAEVGKKDNRTLAIDWWTGEISKCLRAGAWKVILEARASGSVGLYDLSGNPRLNLFETMEQTFNIDDLIFEAPQKKQQIWLIKRYGAKVNLGNVAVKDVIGVECLRQGLRGDTLKNE